MVVVTDALGRDYGGESSGTDYRHPCVSKNSDAGDGDVPVRRSVSGVESGGRDGASNVDDGESGECSRIEDADGGCSAEFSSNAHLQQRPIQIQSSLSPAMQSTIQNVSTVFLTVQQTLNPLMVRAAQKAGRQTGAEFLGSTVVLTTELMRISLCCVILCLGSGSLAVFLHKLFNAFWRNKRETMKVSIPALIYVVQNNLYYFALKHVDATLFSITYQLRILTTALLSILLLRRRFTGHQWVAIFISVVGVVLVQLSSSTTATYATPNATVVDDASNTAATLPTTTVRYKWIGLATVVVMCWTSAFAGVYLEGALKRSSCDILMQNVRLSLVTLPFAILTTSNDADVVLKYGFYHGWTWLVWTVAASSAVGGIVVASVMKYADNVKKSYCQSVALGGTALLSIAVGDALFSWTLAAGVALVITSVFLYTLSPLPPPSSSPSAGGPTSGRLSSAYAQRQLLSNCYTRRKHSYMAPYRHRTRLRTSDSDYEIEAVGLFSNAYGKKSSLNSARNNDTALKPVGRRTRTISLPKYSILMDGNESPPSSCEDFISDVEEAKKDVRK